ENKKTIHFEQKAEEGKTPLSGDGTYSFNDSRNELTVIQKDNATGQETSTIFVKISNDVNASPSVGEIEN
ncbi:MAG: hypothetical protein MJ189_04300, partial [Coriobacteriales bacterium]|nr:hypothetical protein [Coriobacteriales bacterium]